VLSDTTGTAVATITSTNASNGDTVTVGTIVYKFVNTLAAAYDVLIGATADDTADNLAAAINDTSGEGVQYGTGTAANPDVTAVSSVATVTVTNISTGAVSVSLSANASFRVTWSSLFTTGGGFAAYSRADHPCGYQVRLNAYIGSTSPSSTVRNVFYRVSSADVSRNINRVFVTMAATRTYRVRATPYDCFVFRTGTTSDNFYCGALWNPVEWAPPAITAITTGSPTTITQTAHGLSTGQDVTLCGITGSASWEGTTGSPYPVNVVDADNYTIPLDSTSFGTPVSLGTAGDNSQISLAILVAGVGSSSNNFRSDISLELFDPSQVSSGWAHLNGTVYSDRSIASTIACCAITPLTNSSLRVGDSNYYVYQPAIVSLAGQTLTFPKLMGCIWNAVMYQAPGAVETDLDQIPLDSRKFYNLKIGNISPLAQRGALFIEVPAAP
jgi:hypothetical protein